MFIEYISDTGKRRLINLNLCTSIDEEDKKTRLTIHQTGYVDVPQSYEQIKELLSIPTSSNISPKTTSKLDTPLSNFEFSTRTKEFLRMANIYYVGQLVRIAEVDVLDFPGVGRKVLNELKAFLIDKGLRFGLDVSDWTPQI